MAFYHLKRFPWQRALLRTAAALCLSAPAAASAGPAAPPLLVARADLAAYELEDLMDMSVTSVSKKAQRIADAAAAVHVITQEDIRRSGVTNIADALRMVPGVQVARIDGNKWAVSARGFNGRFANKLLVLMDGRSLYTPYFLGVYWELQDTVLEDIDRIEVIRGPGAALWGANAVNGVVNIITKSADRTEGTLVSAGGGSWETASVTARHGLRLGDATHARFYVKHQERDETVTASGADANDAWHATQGGFRVDAQPTSADHITVQGDYLNGAVNETLVQYNFPVAFTPLPYRLVDTRGAMSSGNILTRWQHTLSDTDALSLQAYYDHTERDMLVTPQLFNTVDLEFQHQLSLGGRHAIVWGAGYRMSQYEITNTDTISFSQPHVVTNLYSLFFNDEITLLPSTLSLIIGSRFEQNDHAGFDVQPTGRLLWTVTPHDSVWASVSRAVRSATKGEQDIRYRYRSLPPNSTFNPLPIPLRLEVDGNPNFKSEELLAFEVGYRTEPQPHLKLDLAAYYNDYRNLRENSPGAAFTEPVGGPPQTAVQTYLLSNDMRGHAVGVELSADWLPAEWWRLQASYSYQNLTMVLQGASTDIIAKGNAEGDVPQHQFSVRSGFDLWKEVNLDLWLRGVDRLAAIDGESVPGYITMDARLAWKPCRGLELSAVGQNLFQGQHREFIPEYVNTVPADVVRSFYGKMTWQF